MQVQKKRQQNGQKRLNPFWPETHRVCMHAECLFLSYSTLFFVLQKCRTFQWWDYSTIHGQSWREREGKVLPAKDRPIQVKSARERERSETAFSQPRLRLHYIHRYIPSRCRTCLQPANNNNNRNVSETQRELLCRSQPKRLHQPQQHHHQPQIRKSSQAQASLKGELLSLKQTLYHQTVHNRLFLIFSLSSNNSGPSTLESVFVM